MFSSHVGAFVQEKSTGCDKEASPFCQARNFEAFFWCNINLFQCYVPARSIHCRGLRFFLGTRSSPLAEDSTARWWYEDDIMMIKMRIMMFCDANNDGEINFPPIKCWAGFLWNTCWGARLINALISWNRKYGIGPPVHQRWMSDTWAPDMIVWLRIFVFTLTTISASKYFQEDVQQKSARSDLKNIKIFCPSDSPQYICRSLWHPSDIFTTAPSLLQICTSSCGQECFILTSLTSFPLYWLGLSSEYSGIYGAQ